MGTPERNKKVSRDYRRKLVADRRFDKLSPNSPHFKKVTLRDFPRIMTLLTTISTLSDTESDEMDIKTDLSLGDILHKSRSALKTYSRVRNFIEIIHNRVELAREIDAFFFHIHHLLISKDEMLEMLSLDYYYEQAKSKLDTKDPKFIELDNEILFQTNSTVDQTRGFLAAVDNLRNISDYMYYDIMSSSLQSRLRSDDELNNSLAKIDLGNELVEYILTLRERISRMVNDLGTGISKVYTVKSDIAKIIKKMFEVIPTLKELEEGAGLIGKWALWGLLMLFFLRKG